MIHNALVNILENDSAVAALVGTRIYATLIPLDTAYPAVSLNQVSEFPIDALVQDTDIRKSRFQFDSVDPDFDTVKSVGTAIINVLQRYQGTAASIEVIDIEYENRIDFKDESADVFRDTLDFIVTYRA